jgi:trans-aconitate methyltransferase
MMHGKAFHAPVERPSRVLEVGAGTGYVTRQIASAFPQAEVIGLDLSAVPEGEKTNAVFVQGDAMDDGVVTGPFDFIYSRMLVYGGIRDWPAYFARAWDLLAPGGWLETQEVDASAFFDGEGKDMYPKSSWRNEQRVAFEAKGIDMRVATKLEKYSKNQGFVDVAVKKFHWMHGPWEGHPETLTGAKVATEYNPSVIFEAYKRLLGQTKTAAQLDEVREEINKDFAWSEDGKHRDFWVVYGRKPQH